MSVAVLMAFIAMTFSNVALAQGDHGITFLKGCISPTPVGGAYQCRYTITNNGDTGDDSGGSADTLTFKSISDAVHATPDVLSGNIIASLHLNVHAGAPSCNGTFPGTGNTVCTLPPGASIRSNYFSFHTVAADDPDPLSDTATLIWNDTCDSGANNCPVGDQTTTAGSQSTLTCPTDCNDGDACTVDTCNETTNECESGPRTVCEDDGDLCTEHFECDPNTGLCPDPGPPTVCQDDGDLCTEHFECDPNTGLCPDPGPPTVCQDDGDLCTEHFECDPNTGLCPDPGPRTVCEDDDDLCTEHFECDANTGLCPDPGPRDNCNGDECLECDASTGSCDPIPEEEAPECYVDEICRTPGFWGTHAGDEKGNKSQNITQNVIDSVGSLAVCGTTIDNTNLNNSMSALEAICTTGGGRDHLVRDLTSAQLNCALSDCGGEITDLISDCNDICAANVDEDAMSSCQQQLDCFNNGNVWDDIGEYCITGFGYCNFGGEACSYEMPCVGLEDYCVPIETCHDRDICHGEDGWPCLDPEGKPGAAGSSGACKAARRNNTSVP